MIKLKSEIHKPIKLVHISWNRTREIVVGKVKHTKLVEREQRWRERPREEVAVEEERAKVSKTKKVIWDGPGERIVTEDEDAELVEPRESVGWERPTESVPRNGVTDDPTLLALDALPYAVVEGLVEGVEEVVV